MTPAGSPTAAPADGLGRLDGGAGDGLGEAPPVVPDGDGWMDGLVEAPDGPGVGPDAHAPTSDAMTMAVTAGRRARNDMSPLVRWQMVDRFGSGLPDRRRAAAT
jgi:hypothetical protein